MHDMKINSAILILASALHTMPALAIDAYHLPIPVHSSGAGNIQYQDGGTYIYGQQNDRRQKTQAIALEKSNRIDFELFTADEEEALTSMHDKILRDQLRDEQIRQRKAFIASAQKIDWPKVIRRDNQICVPVLASSEASDWKDHLTCYVDAGSEK